MEAFLSATGQAPLPPEKRQGLERALYCLKDRAKTYPELLEKAAFVLNDRPIVPEAAAAALLDDVSRGILGELTPQLQNATWTRSGIEELVTQFAQDHGLNFGKLAGPLRAALAGRSATPSVFDMMLVLGRDETAARLTDATCGGDGAPPAA